MKSFQVIILVSLIKKEIGFSYFFFSLGAGFLSIQTSFFLWIHLLYELSYAHHYSILLRITSIPPSWHFPFFLLFLSFLFLIPLWSFLILSFFSFLLWKDLSWLLFSMPLLPLPLRLLPDGRLFSFQSLLPGSLLILCSCSSLSPAQCMQGSKKFAEKVAQGGPKGYHIFAGKGGSPTPPRDVLGHPPLVMEVFVESDCSKKFCPSPCSLVEKETVVGNLTHRAPRNQGNKEVLEHGITKTAVVLGPHSSAQDYPSGEVIPDLSKTQIVQDLEKEIHNYLEHP